MDPVILLGLAIILAGFYMAWNIGANDVANAMGTSVGSGALTLKMAVVIAALLEFSGAFFFGSNVSETLQNGLIDTSVFASIPLILAAGMLSCLLSAGIWLQVASYFGLPVSTTHTVVGAIVGFGVAAGGYQAIYWVNVLYVVTSWLISPLLGGCISYILFTMLRKLIFYSKHPLLSTKKLAPILIFVVLTILSLTLVYKGFKNVTSQLRTEQILFISMAIAGVGSVIAVLILRRILARQPIGKHRNSVQEYEQVEKIFGFLQILSASMMAFAHGANDVANAIGPVGAGIGILKTGVVSQANTIPPWTLVLGGVGIVIGLATWGWRVIETVGKKITELTPTRGFAAEFGTAATVLGASALGMPVSTTHTLVGAVIGVGLARGIEALDLRTTRDIVGAWIITVPAGAFLAIVIFYLIKDFL